MRCTLIVVVAASACVVAACKKEAADPKAQVGASASHAGSGGSGGSGSGQTVTKPKSEQVEPPFDIKAIPPDATKTASGLAYKKVVTNDAGQAPKRNDTVLINYTGWKQATGETFFTNKSRGQPMPLPLANAAPGFIEAMQLLKKGERAVLWIPPSIGYKGAPQGNPETLVYEVEIVDIQTAPAVPENLTSPPADAKTTKSGVVYTVVRPGTGTEKPRSFDTVTFQYTAWGSDGRMFDSIEMRKRPATAQPYRQPIAMEEVLTSMKAGERVRFWTPVEKMQLDGRPSPGMPTGRVCYEVELIQITKGIAPPPVPPDVAAPPGNAKKTEKGVSYRVLKAGKGGPKPKASDTVKVHYTGWTTNGRMFDSSVIKGEPTEFSLGGVIAGWTDGIQVMSVGDKVRFWIPEELAYKGAPNKPQGMLVFDVELLEIKPPKAHHDDHGEHEDDEGHGDAGGIPPPIDVAKPPSEAKKTAKGVFYKILSPVKAGASPKPTDTVKVHYTGWTTDGKMFDSSTKRGQPAEFPLTGVIAGWTDGIPQMKVGEKARFWIPKELAYGDQPGRPQGMLVFDVELLEIKPGS